MCGISCILSLVNAAQRHGNEQPRNGEHKAALGAESQKLDKELDASLAQIAHRGPDSCGKWIGEDCRVVSSSFMYMVETLANWLMKGTLAYHISPPSPQLSLKDPSGLM